jgi:hypothetical protein
MIKGETLRKAAKIQMVKVLAELLREASHFNPFRISFS